MDKKKKYEIKTDNLAVPEILTENIKHDTSEEKEEPEIAYDQLAIPEIHIKKKK